MKSDAAPREPAPKPTAGLPALFQLEQAGPLLFRAPPPEGRDPGDPPRAFGGRLVAQALAAAGRTAAPGHDIHSLHTRFLRPGTARDAVCCDVELSRDGTSFSTRRVTVRQEGRALLELTASFQRPRPGPAHQLEAPRVPGPHELPHPREVVAQEDAVAAAWYAAVSRLFPVDVRFVDPLPASARNRPRAPRHRWWFRARDPLGDDRLAHACAVAFVSDMFLLATSLLPHGLRVGMPSVRIASLDHCVWFHRPPQADDWLLYDQECVWSGGGRALCRGSIFDAAGALVATVTQEGLIGGEDVADVTRGG